MMNNLYKLLDKFGGASWVKFARHSTSKDWRSEAVH